jgi:hypothetical protein
MTTQALAADSSGVYFTSGGAVYSCGPTTCAGADGGPAPALVYSGGQSIDAIALSGGTLYVQTASSVLEAPENATGSAGTSYVGVYTDGFAADATNAYYGVTGAVDYSPLTPLPATPAAAMSVTAVVGVAVDATNLYAASFGLNKVVSCAVSSLPCGSSYTTIASSLVGTLTQIASDSTNVWFSTSTYLYKCPIGSACGSPPTPFASRVNAFVVDSVHGYVYWPGSTGIMRCSTSAATCPTPTVISATTSGAGPIAQNATAVYFTDTSGAVNVITK